MFLKYPFIVFDHRAEADHQANHEAGNQDSGSDQREYLVVRVQGHSGKTAEHNDCGADDDGAKADFFTKWDPVFLGYSVSVVGV